MSSPLPYCRTNQTSPDVCMIGMITASAQRRCTYRRRHGTKRKFFNDFSRARACACAQGGVRSESANDIKDPIYETNVFAAHYVHHFAENRYGFHFKDTDEFGLYGFFLADNGKMYQHYYRSDQSFEA